MFTKIGFLLFICFTNSRIPPSYLCKISLDFFVVLSINLIPIPLLRNASSLILFSKIEELNFIDEKISLEGKKVICVPLFFDFPTTFSGDFASPFSTSI